MSIDQRRLCGYLGLARRSKALKVGEQLLDELDKGNVHLLLFLPELSEKHKDRLLRRKKEVETIAVDSIDFLKLKMKKAHAIGITNDGLAKAILDMYRKEEQR